MSSTEETSKNNREENNYYSLSLIQKFYNLTGNIFWHIIDRIAFRVNKIAELYEKSVGGSYKREIKEFNLYDSKNILHIGCGSYPITAIILAEIDNAKIVTIDTNKKSLRLAKEVIKRKKLEDRIKMEYGDGSNFPLDNFDTIIISGCSVPKIRVWNYILNNAKPDTRVIIRDSFFDAESIIGLTNTENTIELVKKMHNNPYLNTHWESYYLVKKSF